ncbi:MAG: AlpA family phage regulatory protein [Anaerolineales bacterium]|nr:AlpA family phage regulatory protein [Anaerolineales bacterium]
MAEIIQEASYRKQEALLRKREVLKLTGLSNSSLYNYIKAGVLKPGVPIGTRMKGWPASEIEAYIQSCIASRDRKMKGSV